MTPTLNRQPVFECISGPDEGRTAILLPQTRLVLGRNPESNIPLVDPQTAEQHLSILYDGQNVYFQTINGEPVELNGRNVTTGELNPAADLRIGSSHWRLRVKSDSTDSGSGNPFANLDFSSSVNRISTLTGVDTLDSDFSMKSIFAKIGEKRTDEDIENAFTVGTRATTPVVGTIASHWPQPWLFLRFGGSAILLFITLYVAVTQFRNELLIPGLLFVGSFAVPFASLIFFWEMNAPQNISLYQTIKLLFLGGMVSLLISLFFFSNTALLGTFLGASSAGIVEESGKLLAVLMLMRNKNQYHWILNGLLFGAAVGTGFAAFESAGYAFVVLLQGGFGSAISNIFLRGLLAPFSHVVWTAITAAAIWRVKGEGKFEWDMLKDPRFLRTFIAVMLLHMVWNAPFDFPIFPVIWFIPTKQLILGTIAWIMVLGTIQSGLKQIKKAQEAVLQPAPTA
ncbi:PrsW family intramembrane metalloprotease [Spirosoma sp. BT702]|uniref:PrsW family intramembrane metalloprotease n=1 Tax=Spirosoma profusum TaxID=2771354 RepID=A0A926XU59_9BACT|nr:PrsW family glutamic-type intramembrane protease [Spirosoma profusum]MBD2700222.1 PrsW family intramembrane metalloprotease [Spirosoma profusum]